MTLNKYAIGVTIATVTLFIGIIVQASVSQSVTINADKWMCVGSETVGIQARCTAYQLKSMQLPLVK